MCNSVKFSKRALKAQKSLELSDLDLFNCICDINKGKFIKKFRGRLIKKRFMYRHEFGNNKRLIYLKENSVLKILDIVLKQGISTYEHIDDIMVETAEYSDFMFEGFNFDEFKDFLIEIEKQTSFDLTDLRKCNSNAKENISLTNEVKVVQNELDEKIKNKKILCEEVTVEIKEETVAKVIEIPQFDSLDVVMLTYEEQFGFLKKIRYNDLEDIFLKEFNKMLKNGINLFKEKFSQSRFIKILTELKNNTFNKLNYKLLSNI